jgi:hypothetical protein
VGGAAQWPALLQAHGFRCAAQLWQQLIEDAEAAAAPAAALGLDVPLFSCSLCGVACTKLQTWPTPCTPTMLTSMTRSWRPAWALGWC